MIRSNNHITIELPHPLTSVSLKRERKETNSFRLRLRDDSNSVFVDSQISILERTALRPKAKTQQKNLSSLQIHTRRHLSIDLLRKRERERDRYKNLVMDCSPAGGIESLRLLLNPPFFISSSSSFFSSSLSLFSFLIFSTQIKSHYIKVRLNFMRNHGD